MTAHFRSVWTELVSALAVDHTLIGGRYSLAPVGGTPRVIGADSGLPTTAPPLLMLSGPKIRPDYSSTLGLYGIVTTIEWFAYAPPTNEEYTTENRMLAAVDLANDVIKAVQLAHQSSSFPTLHGLTTLLATLDDTFGDGPELPPACGLAIGQILYTTQLLSGV